jgi:PHD/YefM family antitoxin component YafN of YafNO toxin-antitoxin module
MVKLYGKYNLIFIIQYTFFDMNGLTFINGAIVTATDVRKFWSKIVQGLKDSHKPVFVCKNNTPEAVILSFEEFQNMQEIVQAARREQLGQQMVCDLLDIAQLTDQPIKHVLLNSKGVFEEAKGQ